MIRKKKRGRKKQKEYDILVGFKSRSGDDGKGKRFFGCQVVKERVSGVFWSGF
jgi:hypothetical protein